MSRLLISPLLFLLLSLPATVLAQEAADAANAAPGEASGATARSSVSSLTIQGENIYLDGVLQNEKFRPGMDVAIRDGKAVLVPRAPASTSSRISSRTSARPDALKAARERENDVAKAQLKARSKPDTQGIEQNEALSGVEKRAARAEASVLANTRTSARLGDTTSRTPKPGSDADIPPETRKLIENARRMSQ